MGWTVAKVYVHALLFLQVFTLVLSVSTYVNHGLPKGGILQLSVRSPVRDTILPIVGDKTKMDTDVSQLQTLCSTLHSHVLCTVFNHPGERAGLKRIRRKRTTHSKSSTTHKQQLESSVGSAVSSSITGLGSNSNYIDRLIANRHLTAHQRNSLNIKTLDFTNINANMEDIISNLLRRTDHERQPSGAANLRTTRRSLTAVTATSPSTSTTAALSSRHHRITSRNSESHSTGRGTVSGNRCSRQGYCLNGGSCIYDSLINTTDCR